MIKRPDHSTLFASSGDL